MNFGRALRVARAARGLSQKDVAELVRVKPSYVSLLESGKRQNPSVAVMQQFATALGIPVDLLLLLATEDADGRKISSADAQRIGEAMVRLYGESDGDAPPASL